MERYLLTLTPNVGLTPDEFVEAWNNDSETSNKAWASYTPESATDFNFIGDVINVTLLLQGISINAIYDLIKIAITKGISMASREKKEIVDQSSITKRVQFTLIKLPKVSIIEVTLEKEEQHTTKAHGNHSHH